MIKKIYRDLIRNSIMPPVSNKCNVVLLQTDNEMDYSSKHPPYDRIADLILKYVNLQYALAEAIASPDMELHTIGFILDIDYQIQINAAKALFGEVIGYTLNDNYVALSLKKPSSIALDCLRILRKIGKTNRIIDYITNPSLPIDDKLVFRKLIKNEGADVYCPNEDPFITYILHSSHYMVHRRALRVYGSIESIDDSIIANALYTQYDYLFLFSEKDANEGNYNVFLAWLNDDELPFSRLKNNKKLVFILVTLTSYLMLQLVKYRLWLPLALIFLVSVYARHYYEKLRIK